jgi:hypothetical protein
MRLWLVCRLLLERVELQLAAARLQFAVALDVVALPLVGGARVVRERARQQRRQVA